MNEKEIDAMAEEIRAFCREMRRKTFDPTVTPCTVSPNGQHVTCGEYKPLNPGWKDSAGR